LTVTNILANLFASLQNAEMRRKKEISIETKIKINTFSSAIFSPSPVWIERCSKEKIQRRTMTYKL